MLDGPEMFVVYYSGNVYCCSCQREVSQKGSIKEELVQSSVVFYVNKNCKINTSDCTSVLGGRIL